MPPLLRAAEYGLLARMAVLAGARLDQCYALLAALAFHHYDLMYRIRTRGTAPPDWLRLAAGGWDGRLLGAYGLLLTKKLPSGFAVGAALLGTLFVAESVLATRRWLADTRLDVPVQRPADGEAEA